jgi:hypothetical protein
MPAPRPTMTVNGRPLTPAQVAAIHVAIQRPIGKRVELAIREAQGDAAADGYLNRLREVMAMMATK